MTQLSTPEESLQVLLAICAELRLRPGHVLPAQHLWLKCVRRGLRSVEIEAGIRKGVEIGYFESFGKMKHLLTDAGLDAMPPLRF